MTADLNRTAASPPYPPAVGGFSLVELLVVLAIIAILSALAVPAISGALRGYRLDTTGQIVVNQLNLARQTALSQGHAVQVRFYELPDFNAASTSTPTVYRGMQSFIESDPNSSSTFVTATPLIKPIFFPAPVILSIVTSPTAVSPLISGTSTTTVTVNSNDSANPLPGYGATYQYVVFHFRPDGSTDLTNTTNSLSLVLENDKPTSSGLPSNFQSIVIDPLNGAIRSFRP